MAKGSKPNSGVTAYLFLYNLLSFAGWAYVLYLTITPLPLEKWFTSISLLSAPLNTKKVFANSVLVLTWVQTAALLEVVHSILGFVKSPVITTLMQVTSRLFLVWAVCNPYRWVVASSPVYISMVLAWSITELVRYAYYATSLLNMTPKILVWQRYTYFYLLYPLGAGSEAFLVYLSLPAIENQMVKYAYMAVLLIYIPGFYTMYTHMIGQRKKYLGPVSTSSRSSPSSKRRVKKE